MTIQTCETAPACASGGSDTLSELYPGFQNSAAAEAAVAWLQGWMAELFCVMALRGRRYCGPIIADGERHEIETMDWRRERSNSWYRVQLEPGPMALFGWTGTDGEILVRWSAGKHELKVAPERAAAVLHRFVQRRVQLEPIKRDRAEMLSELGKLIP